VLTYLKVSPDHEEPLVFDRSLRAAVDAGEGDTDGAGRDAGVVRGARSTPAAGVVVAAVHRSGGAAGGAENGGAVGAVRASIGGLALTPETRKSGGPAVMPDLAGLSLRQANEALASRGLVCRNDKRGSKVTRQDPEPGEAVAPGSSGLVIY
jgi:PASTA domain-containing protein